MEVYNDNFYVNGVGSEENVNKVYDNKFKAADKYSTVNDSTNKMIVCNREKAVYTKCKAIKEQSTTVIPASIESQMEDDKIKNASDDLSEEELIALVLQR